MDGLVYDLSFADYRAEPGTNGSIINAGRKSMLHMHHEATTNKEPTAAMKWGTILHTAILEPERFQADRSVWDGGRKYGKTWEAFKDGVPDEALIVSPDDLDKARAMRKRVYGLSEAKYLIENSKHEVSAFWESKYCGAAKGRMDILIEDNMIADYKTTAGIEPFAFWRTAYSMGYHIKAGWYVHGVEVITGKRLPFRVIVQEATAPYDCWVCEIDDGILRKGEEEAREIARRYYTHARLGQFPGVVTDGVIPYEMPAWAMSDEVDMGGLIDD